MKTLNSQITEIIANFDWAKVHKTMTVLNWEWDNGRVQGVPSIGDLVNAATDLLDSVANSDGKYHSSSSGGFVASIEDGCLDLSFVVESYCAEKEE